jgi:hypothetical protein
LAVALSRFGTFTGLRIIDTGTFYCTVVSDPCALAPGSCFPHTHGLSFFGTKYHSSYLSFAAIVLQDVHGKNLESPTRREITQLKPFDPQAQTPAVDVGGEWGFLGVGFSPGILGHRTWTQIAGGLANPVNPVSRQIDASANLFTAAICKATKGRPAGVCKSSGVAAAAALLH